jgi:regulator of sigma E protease
MMIAQSKPNGEVNLNMTVERDGELVDLVIPRQFDDAEGRYMAGFVFQQEPVNYTFWESIGLSFKWLVAISNYTDRAFFGLFTGATNINEVGGILMVTDSIQQAFHISLVTVLDIVALLSVNLAVMNLLPFPALDGGRIVFLAIEGIFKKPVKREVEATIHAIGMVLLFAFVFFMIYKDAIRVWFGG